MATPRIDTFSDSAQAAAAVAETLQDQFIHVTGIGWMEYTGRKWRPVDDKVPLAALRRWTGSKVSDAAFRGDQDVKGWVRRLDAGKLRNALFLAAGFDGISVESHQLDANPDVLNCRNGVLYLPTGDLTPHLPELYLTKCTDVDYEPMLHDDWTAALGAVPEDVLPWLHTRFGQAITGHTNPDDRVVIQQGGGANGKSTVLAGIAAAIGDYYFLASDKILMGGQNGAHTTDLADLRGTRFVAIEETPEAGRLDVVRLKKVAGTASITARKLYQDNVSFPASHTLFVNTNYPPVVGETDEGTWRRLALVVYPYTFTASPVGADERPGDPHLRGRLSGQEQAKAALAWLADGAQRWYQAQRAFPPIPARVAEDTDSWRFQTDLIATFWEDHLDPDPGSYIYTGDLIWMFNQFMRQHGNSPLAESTFVRRFGNHRITLGAMITKIRLRQTRNHLDQSRPYGTLDVMSKLPASPQGQVWCWVGLKFRPMSDTPSDLRFRENESGESS